MIDVGPYFCSGVGSRNSSRGDDLPENAEPVLGDDSALDPRATFTSLALLASSRAVVRTASSSDGLS